MGMMSRGFVQAGFAPRVGKRDVSIQELLHWAFQRELASLDFDEFAKETGARPGVGIEWIMIQTANLGCRVDGGGKSSRHHDADLVASALAVLPENVGGRRMAVQIAELARKGELPNWGQDAQPRCEPVSWRLSKHGPRGVRRYNDYYKDRWPIPYNANQPWNYFCPVRYVDDARWVAGLRRNYLLWRLALTELRNTFQIHDNLTSFKVTDGMPAMQPWKKPLD